LEADINEENEEFKRSVKEEQISKDKGHKLVKELKQR